MALPLKKRALLALPLPAAWMSNVVIHNVYVKFYTDIVGLDASYVGWVYFWFNIWNVINDPIFGVLIDKLPYKPGRGKYVRVMRITVPFLLVGLAVMAWTPSSWPQSAVFGVFLTELFLFDVASTFYMISATNYVYLAAPTREDRIDVEVVRAWLANIFSAVATIVATQLLVGGSITDRITISTMLMCVVLVNGGLYVFAALKLKDPPELYELGDGGETPVTLARLRDDIKTIVTMRAFWAWFFYGLIAYAPMGIYFTAFLYFMDNVIMSSGTEATITDMGSMLAVLILLPFYARIVKKIGSRFSIWLSTIPYLVGFALMFFVTTWWQVLICYFLIMSGRNINATASVALEGALIDDNERATGIRKAGTIAAVRTLLTAPVAGIQMVIFMAILASAGYDQSVMAQTESVRSAIRFAVAGIPIIFVIVGLIPLLFVPYTKAREAELSRYSAERRSGESDGAVAQRAE